MREDAEIAAIDRQQLRGRTRFAPTGDANTVGLFVEVEDFGDILKRLDGYPITMSERTTFYGMREIGVHEPSGHIVVFAAKT